MGKTRTKKTRTEASESSSTGANTAAQPKVMHLALQGGGAHGAFTWGVLDRLLDEPGFSIGRISGTSAGALNGAALASGHALGGERGAQAALSTLWHKVAQTCLPFTLLSLPLRRPGLGLWDDALPLLSPLQANPLGLAPIRAALEACVDVDALRRAGAPALFVNAVSVQTGEGRVFGPDEISHDVLLASACAPMMFEPVQIGDESYWDGSYAGNPALWPLHEGVLDADIFMVELTPLRRDELPTSPKNILNRINEIASAAGLRNELRAIEAINRTVQDADLRLHVVSLSEDGAAVALDPSTKRTVGIELFLALRDAGRGACEQWLAQRSHLVGTAASTDINRCYLDRSARHPSA